MEGQSVGLVDTSPGRWVAGDRHKVHGSWCCLLTDHSGLIGVGVLVKT